MHTQCCSLCYSQALLWTPQCALKAADHLVRAFSSVSAHSKALLSYTDDDSEVSANREGRMHSKASWTDAKTRGKKLENKPLSGILFSEVKEDFCSPVQSLKRLDLWKNPQERGFSTPLLQVFVSAQQNFLEFTGMRTPTLSTHSQISKASFCKIPPLLFIKRHYLAFQFHG